MISPDYLVLRFRLKNLNYLWSEGTIFSESLWDQRKGFAISQWRPKEDTQQAEEKDLSAASEAVVGWHRTNANREHWSPRWQLVHTWTNKTCFSSHYTNDSLTQTLTKSSLMIVVLTPESVKKNSKEVMKRKKNVQFYGNNIFAFLSFCNFFFRKYVSEFLSFFYWITL